MRVVIFNVRLSSVLITFRNGNCYSNENVL